MLEIGSLISISKSFLETFAILKKLVGESRNSAQIAAVTEMRDRVNAFQTRLQGLAIQLEQTERLTRMIPAWEAYATQIPVWKDVPSLPDADAQQIHVALRHLPRPLALNWYRLQQPQERRI